MESQEGKYLTFTIADEEYGIHILKVKEIIGIMDITKVPKTPDFIKGVINLRGRIIPIMDLRLKFCLQEVQYNERTCIVVVEINTKDAQRLMGVAVDMVSEVLNIQSTEIEPPPQYGASIDEGFLTGMGKVKDKVVMLVDIEKVLSSEELDLINNMKRSGASV